MKKRMGTRLGSLGMTMAVMMTAMPVNMPVYADTVDENLDIDSGTEEHHVHSADCYCPGGEYLCEEIETEPHEHDESCYDDEVDLDDIDIASVSNAAKKHLICGLEETEGHTHDDSCVCPGGELLCGFEDDTDTSLDAEETDDMEETLTEEKTDELSEQDSFLEKLKELIDKLPKESDVENMTEEELKQLQEQLDEISDYVEEHDLELSEEQEAALMAVADAVNARTIDVLQEDAQVLLIS